MLTAIEASNSRGETFLLTLNDPSSGYLVLDVDGIDPVKATLVSSSFAGLDGEEEQSSRRDARDIKLKIELLDGYDRSIRELRRELLRFFMPKQVIILKLFLDEEPSVMLISGRVEEAEIPMFAEQVVADLSVRCFDPDFRDDEPVVITGKTVNSDSETQHINSGTVESGLELTVYPDRAMNGFSLYIRNDDLGVKTLDFAMVLQAGDKIEISTVPGNKGAVLTRAGVRTPVLYAVSPYSAWVQMGRDDNFFRVYAEGAPVDWEIAYLPRYGSV